MLLKLLFRKVDLSDTFCQLLTMLAVFDSILVVSAVISFSLPLISQHWNLVILFYISDYSYHGLHNQHPRECSSYWGLIKKSPIININIRRVYKNWSIHCSIFNDNQWEDSLWQISDISAHFLPAVSLPDASHPDLPQWVHLVCGGRGPGEILHHCLSVSQVENE